MISSGVMPVGWAESKAPSWDSANGPNPEISSARQSRRRLDRMIILVYRSSRRSKVGLYQDTAPAVPKKCEEREALAPGVPAIQIHHKMASDFRADSRQPTHVVIRGKCDTLPER